MPLSMLSMLSSNDLYHPLSRLPFSVSQCFVSSLYWCCQGYLILYHPMFCVINYRFYQGCHSLSFNDLYHASIDAIKAANPLSSNVLCHSLLMLSRLPFSVINVLYHPLSMLSRLLSSIIQCFVSSLIDAIMAANRLSSNVWCHPLSMLSRLPFSVIWCFYHASIDAIKATNPLSSNVLCHP